MRESREAAPGNLATDPLGSPLARAAFEASPAGLLVFAADGTILAMNGAFARLCGLDAAGLVGRHYSAFSDDLEVRRLDGAVGPKSWVTPLAVRGERVEAVLQTIRNRSSGIEFVARCGAAPLFEDGRLVATTVTVEDVTEATRVQQAIEGALSASEVGTYRIDLVERRVWGDPNFARIYGLSDEEARGGPVARLYGLIHPEDVDRVASEVGEATRVGGFHEIEFRVLVPSGVRWILSRGRAELGEDGAAVQRIGSVVDVTARREAQEDLRLTQESLGLAMRGSRMGWWRRDLLAGEVVWSRELEAIFGLEPGSFDGSRQSFLDFVHPDERGRLEATVARALAAGEDYTVEFRFRRADGTEGWMEGRGKAVYDGSGRPIASYGIGVDVTERKVTEQALRDAKARTDAILTSADVATWVLDVQNDRLYADRNLARFFDLPQHIADGGPAADYIAKIHPEDQARVARELGGAIAEGVPYDVEYRIVARGEERWVTARGIPERGQDGRVVRLPGVVVDVTQLKRAHERAHETAEALRESESQYRLLVESVPEIAWTARPDGHLDYYNERWYEYTGRDRGEQGDVSWTPLLHPDDLDGTYEAFRRSIETGEPYEVELRLRGAATGDFRWFLARARPMRGPSGEIVRWFGVTSDIDDQKRTQQALAIANRLGSALTQDLDPDRVVQALSDASTEAIGADFGSFFYARPEEERDLDGGERFGLYVLSGAPLEAFASFPPVRSTPLFTPTFSGEGPVRSDDVSRDPRFSGMPEGHLPVRSYLATPVRGRDGSVLGGLLFGHSEPCRFTEDHQRLVESFAAQASVAYENAILYERLRDAKEGLERRVAERTEELTRANRDLNEFSYSVAHDLRAPLRAIVSTSRILLEDVADRLNEEEREALDRQAANATRLAKIVDDLLGFARLANAEPRRKGLDMADLARRAADEVRARREGACEIRIQEGMVAQGDPSLVGYVFTNLIDNACKFTKGEGVVSVGEEGGAFFVRDQGVGFDMAHAPKLFVAFERLVGQDEFEGTGVGLANVKRIVEKHGGRVWAESEPGRGATFWFKLA